MAYATGGARSIALRILAARFGEPWPEGGAASQPPTFALAAFQASAVRRAARILDARRGVVVADSVGLGKTYVALALIERELRRGGRVAVAAPAALRREWLGALRNLGRSSGVRGVCGVRGEGGADAAVAATGAADRAFLAWLTHERLSRGTYPHARLAALDLVVVDEAHAFRSPRTRRYRALAALCRGARVVLLTATPVNNSVWDLYFQLRLFCGDGAFRDIGVPDLREAFRAAADAGGAAPPSLLPVLREVVIRRTRPFLRVRYGAIRTPGAASPLVFPRRAPPVPIRYSLDTVGPGIDAIVDTLERLTLAPLRPERYIAGSVAAASDATTAGVAELVRAGLLKRLESSVAAFDVSLRRQVRFLDAFIRALDHGRLLRPRDHRALYAGGDGDPAQLILEAVALLPPPPGLDLERLRRDAVADRARLARLLRRFGAPPAEATRSHHRRAAPSAGRDPTIGHRGAAPVGADPKLDRLIALLDRELRGCKVLIFTEYRDTARHLWRALARRGGVALIDGDGAFLGPTPAGRRAVIERFAPRANHVRPPPARERVDVLIATDVLAEGLNLQDADHVVSYDLPWNPVRLIQRIGRIDRLGSPHEVVHTYHFLPDRGLDRALRLLDRLRAKLTAIGRTVGAEGAVLHGSADEAGPGDASNAAVGAGGAATGREAIGVDVAEVGGEAIGAAATGAGTGAYYALVDRLAAGDPDALDAIERADAAAFEVEEQLSALWEQATQAASPGARQPAASPGAGRPAASPVAGMAGAATPAAGPRAPTPAGAAAPEAAAPEAVAPGTAAPEAAAPRAAASATAAPGAAGAPDAMQAASATPAACVTVAPERPHRVLVAYSVAGRPVWSVVEIGDAAGAAGSGAAPGVVPGAETDVAPGTAPGTAPGAAGRAAGNATRGMVRSRAPAARSVADPDAAAVEILQAALDAPAAPATPVDPRAVAQALDAARPRVAERVAALTGDGRLHAASAAAAAARRVLAALAAIPGGPDPELCRRADRLLAALGRSVDAGAEAALRSALARADGVGDDPRHATADVTRRGTPGRALGDAPANTRNRTPHERRAESLIRTLEQALDPVRSAEGATPVGRRADDPSEPTPFQTASHLAQASAAPAVELAGILEARPARVPPATAV